MDQSFRGKKIIVVGGTSGMGQAVARARDDGGPTLVECKTVRWERHSAISAGKYENEEAMLAWKRADPIPRLEAILRERRIADDLMQAARTRAKTANDEALGFAIASAPPLAESAGDFVFA